MARKALSATLAPTVLSLALVALLTISISGCGNNYRETVVDEKVEETYSLDFNSQNYQYVRSERPKDFLKRIKTWTPISEQAADYLRQGNLEEALNLLYQDILATDSKDEDQLIFSVLTSEWKILFTDPALIFSLYRDADKSNLSDDEKAACDLMVALTYEVGNFNDSLPEEFSTDDDSYKAYDALRLKLYGVAKETCKRIIDRYSGSRVAALARVILAHNYEKEEGWEGLLTGLSKEVERNYPDSVYLAFVNLILGNRYEGVIDGTGLEKAISTYKKILALPNIYFSSSDSNWGDVHSFTEKVLNL